VRGNFPNKDERLTPGLFVRIRLPIGGERTRVLVPDSILGSDQGQRYAYVVNGDEVERRDVTVGLLRDGKRPIEGGLKPGEWVITNGMQRVRPGAKVDPKKLRCPLDESKKKNSSTDHTEDTDNSQDGSHEGRKTRRRL